MKRSFLCLLMLSIALPAIAQDSEINDAEDFNEDGKYQKARKILSTVEKQIPNASEGDKADYYLAKGFAYMGNRGQGRSAEDLKIAAQAFKKAKRYGEEDDAKKGLKKLRGILVNTAVQNQNKKQFNEASKKLHLSYKLNPKDTILLFYAANNALNGQKYKRALKYYKTLRSLDFKGTGIVYTLKNKRTGKIETFQSKNKRDTYLKSKQYTDPGIKKLKSKQADITKFIALIYDQLGQTQKAKQAVEIAIKNNPQNLDLKLVKAEILKKLGNEKAYTKILRKVAKQDPDNAQLLYRLGNKAMQAGQKKKAKAFLEKTIRLNPEIRGAYINRAVMILDEAQAIKKKMNGLGFSDADEKKYKKLNAERKEIFKKAIPYLKKAIKLKPEESSDEIKQLRNIYLVIGQKKKAQELKNKY